ncbi:hypothetical protein GJ496_011096 [Pomphorhynchus laevis]|nr:hypothetical protein GJ496_011096 [Pomphorhynchus laevis]
MFDKKNQPEKSDAKSSNDSNTVNVPRMMGEMLLQGYMNHTDSPLSAKRIVYIGGLAENVTVDILRNALLPFGEIVDVQMPLDYQTQKHRGFGFAEFELTEDATAAVDNLNGSEIFGRTLRVNLAKSTLQRKPNELATRPVWADDEWLQKYAGGMSQQQDVSTDEATSTPLSTITVQPSTTLSKQTEPNPQVYLDIHIDNIPCGRLVCELFADIVPKTTENFRLLCTGYQTTTCKNLCYRGTSFHRIIPDFMCQAGDITKSDGTGGRSIYGDKFADENFKLNHDKRGILSMANSGPHSNNSQFFISFGSADWLDGKHVVFGKVAIGMDVLNRIEACGSKAGKPRKSVVIVDCGEVKTCV